MNRTQVQFDRRQMLVGSGAAIALPFLESFLSSTSLIAGATPEEPPMRMVCIGLEYGLHPDDFFPKESGRGYQDERGRAGREVDTSGRLATGEEFAGLDELKRLLLRRKDEVARCLTEKLLTYALGRELRQDDRPQVDAIIKSAAAHGHGLRELVNGVVTSGAFRE